ncbi:hypothetical protein KY285_017935 [Solanum tuberosum]|nr:hypothetical protein KY285_017935 [Solanum tuberosum]
MGSLRPPKRAMFLPLTPQFGSCCISVTAQHGCEGIVISFDDSVSDCDSICLLQISRLIYTNSGDAILVLASNAINLLWKWLRNERNSGGKTTTSVSPVLWQPSSGILMTNDVQEPNHEEAVSWFALSKNACYVISTSGGKISLFNMMIFKRVRTFMPPPPAATYIAFHPQDNNIIAIGMDNSTIQIYNVRLDEVKSKLKGHSKRITGIAFSYVLNVLVSSGADSQRARSLQLRGRSISQSATRAQFHQDQTHFFVVHEAQIAIYETTKLKCLKHISPLPDYSCQLIHASFLDATVCIFTAGHLHMRCRYYSFSLFFTQYEANGASLHHLKMVLQKVCQQSEGKWGVPPPLVNGFAEGVPAAPSSGA